MFKNVKKKTVVIMMAIILPVAAAALVCTFLVVKKDEKEKPVLPPEYYFAKADELSSVTDIVGERSFEDLSPREEASGSTDGTGETQIQESSEEGNTEAATAEEPGNTDKEGLSVEKYRYIAGENTPTDVKEYIAYLTEKKNFIDLTQEEDEDEEEPEEEKKTYTYKLAGPSHDSDAYLEIIIEAEDDSFTVTALKKGEAWNSYVTQLWDEEKKKNRQKTPEEPKSTMQIAEEKGRSMSQEALKLQEPVDTYSFVCTPGLIKLEDKDFYRVSAYKKKENGTMIYECAYLVECASRKVSYKYNYVTEETELLE